MANGAVAAPGESVLPSLHSIRKVTMIMLIQAFISVACALWAFATATSWLQPDSYWYLIHIPLPLLHLRTLRSRLPMRAIVRRHTLVVTATFLSAAVTTGMFMYVMEMADGRLSVCRTNAGTAPMSEILACIIALKPVRSDALRVVLFTLLQTVAVHVNVTCLLELWRIQDAAPPAALSASSKT